MSTPPVDTNRFGPLEPGLTISEGWRVGNEFRFDARLVRVTLERQDGTSVTFVIGLPGVDPNPGKFDTDGVHIAYDHSDKVPFSEFEAAGVALVDKLKAAGGESLPGAVAGWLKEANR